MVGWCSMVTFNDPCQIKGKIIKQAVRACLWAPGAVPDQGGFEPLCVSSLPARKPGICELGRFLGKTVNSRKTESFWDLGMPSTSCILDVFQGGKLKSSAPSESSSLFFQLWHGQLPREKSVLGGKGWTNRKILVCQNRKTRFSARSEARSLFFQL